MKHRPLPSLPLASLPSLSSPPRAQIFSQLVVFWIRRHCCRSPPVICSFHTQGEAGTPGEKGERGEEGEPVCISLK